MGFPGSSSGKESTCNAGDPGSIPGSGSSPGEGISYLLQCSWASLVSHTGRPPGEIGQQRAWVAWPFRSRGEIAVIDQAAWPFRNRGEIAVVD